MTDPTMPTREELDLDFEDEPTVPDARPGILPRFDDAPTGVYEKPPAASEDWRWNKPPHMTDAEWQGWVEDIDRGFI